MKTWLESASPSLVETIWTCSMQADTYGHNRVIQRGSRAYAGVVTLFRIISTRNSLEVAGVLCSPSRARVSHWPVSPQLGISCQSIGHQRNRSYSL